MHRLCIYMWLHPASNARNAQGTGAHVEAQTRVPGTQNSARRLSLYVLHLLACVQVRACCECVCVPMPHKTACTRTFTHASKCSTERDRRRAPDARPAAIKCSSWEGGAVRIPPARPYTDFLS
jgi:hypothetical protein